MARQTETSAGNQQDAVFLHELMTEGDHVLDVWESREGDDPAVWAHPFNSIRLFCDPILQEFQIVPRYGQARAQ